VEQAKGAGTDLEGMLRRALDRHGKHFSREARAAAVTFGAGRGWTVPVDLPALLRLAESFESFAVGGGSWRDADGELMPTPAGRVERLAALRRYDPAVKRLRTRVFGGERAPFRRPADALGWLRSRYEAQEGALDVDGLEVEGRSRPPDVSREEWRQRSLEADALPVRWGTIAVTRIWARPRSYPLWPLARLGHRIARTLDVAPGQVVAYMLTGAAPEFSPARIRGRVERDRVDGGLEVAVPRVEISVFTPELTQEELRSLQRQVRACWPTVDAEVDLTLAALERGRRRPTITQADAELADVVQELGGEPEPGGRAAFWERVRHVWVAHGNEAVAADSLRRRWRRLQRKRPPEPEPGT